MLASPRGHTDARPNPYPGAVSVLWQRVNRTLTHPAFRETSPRHAHSRVTI